MKRLYVKGKQFWAIDQNYRQSSVAITEGALGTPGTSKTFTFKTQEKVEAGWRKRRDKALAAGFKPPAPKEATNAELEAAIRANPEDDASYAVYPALETLRLWFGDPDYGSTAKLADVSALLDGKQVPKVVELALANTDGALGNQIAAAVIESKIVKQLRVLDLSGGSIDDEGAAVLVAGKSALGHLQRLDLSDNYLTPAGVKLVKKLAKEVLVDDQREPYDWDEDQRRYASVGE